MHDTLSGLADSLLSLRGLAALIGAAGTAGSLYYMATAWLSLSWPKTKGRIVASLVDVRYGRYGRSEEPVVAYQYAVDGRVFNRANINAGLDWSWSTSIPGLSSAQAEVDEYPIDREVDVYYWPQFPGVACLRPGEGRAGAAGLLVIGLLLLGGAALLGR